MAWRGFPTLTAQVLSLGAGPALRLDGGGDGQADGGAAGAAFDLQGADLGLANLGGLAADQVLVVGEAGLQRQGLAQGAGAMVEGAALV